MIQASYKYPDGSEYKGEWNAEGQRHGIGNKEKKMECCAFSFTLLILTEI